MEVVEVPGGQAVHPPLRVLEELEEREQEGRVRRIAGRSPCDRPRRGVEERGEPVQVLGEESAPVPVLLAIEAEILQLLAVGREGEQIFGGTLIHGRIGGVERRRPAARLAGPVVVQER